MAQYLTPGTRVSLLPEGRQVYSIPVSTTDDSAATVPTAPSGTRLVGVEYVQRPDGGRDYTFTFETAAGGGGGTGADKQQEITGQASQEPVETHPSFNGLRGGGTVTDADLAEIRRALQEGNEPTFTGTGSALTAAQELHALKLKGVENYYTPSGITYSETTDEGTKPSLNDLCTITTPPPDAPTVPTGTNWILIGLRAQKLVNPTASSSFWRVTREWLASGPRGWNADFELYE
jgi:hypothetical protein